MARMTKQALIAELRGAGVLFDENAKYEDLWKLRKGSHKVCTGIKPPGWIPPELRARAAAIGFADEQIDTYTDAEKLKAACDAVKPEVTPHLPPKKRQIFRPFKDEPKGEPAQAVCTSTITTLRAEHLVRAGYDQSNLEVFCRKEKIRPETIQKVTVIRNYVPNKREILTTTMIIDYFKKG